MRVILALLLLAPCAWGQELIRILPASRVGNTYTEGQGVCWFACAATLGKHLGIARLHDLPERVIKARVGFPGGATQESVDHWVKELKLRPLHTAGDPKGGESLAKVQAWLDRGLPVIMSYGHETGAHAVLVVRISREKERWKTDKGTEVHDHAVSYYDPDDKQVWRGTWGWFYPAWTGRAYTFDPRDQGIATPPVAKGTLHRPRELHAPDKRLMLSHVSPPAEVRYQMPPYYGHQVPYSAEGPPFPRDYRFPSNQDIKDGVTRPRDVFPSYYYGHAGIDYHSEYEAFKAGKRAP